MYAKKNRREKRKLFSYVSLTKHETNKVNQAREIVSKKLGKTYSKTGFVRVVLLNYCNKVIRDNALEESMLRQMELPHQEDQSE